MLEIIALVLLTKGIGKLAIKKGKQSGTWKLFTVLAWIGGEIIGAVLGFAFFQSEDYIAMLPFALVGAVGGYLIVRAILSKMPDKPEESFEFENNNNNNQ